MGGMDLWVSYPVAFKQLDDYINKQNTVAELDALVAKFDTAHPFFGGNTSPLPSGSQSHFEDHWLGNPPTVGGSYWPYLRDIDVGHMLQCALKTSVRAFASARKKRVPQPPTKFHATLWTCSLPVPPGYLGNRTGYSASVPEQEDMFRIAVIELDYVVQVLISTPEPDPEELVKEYDELDVAYLVPHYRLHPVKPGSEEACVWVQYVHPMKERWARIVREDVSFGERPPEPKIDRTVPGRQAINTDWDEG